MPSAPIRLNPLALVALAGSALAATNSHAALVNWSNASGGSATTLTNWNPQVLPGAGDSINFNIIGGYIVTWGAGAPSSVTDLTIGSSNAGFTFTTPLTVTGTCLIQNTSSAAGGASTVSSGTLTVNNLVVGAAANSSTDGEFHINGANAHLNVNNSCIVGNLNEALLRVIGNASMTSNTPLRVGVGDIGNMLVSGATATDRSTLQVAGAGNTIRVGDGAQGTLTISNGALATTSGDVFAGPVINEQGLITVSGASNGFDATLTIPGQLYIANNNAAGAGGVGTVTVETGGAVTVGGQTIIGDSSPSNGFLQVHGGSFLTHGLLANGNIAGFVHTNGTVTVDGGTLALKSSGAIYNVAGAGTGGGVLTLQNNVQWTLPIAGSAASPVFLTSVGAGSTLNLLSSSDFFHTGSEVRVGISGERGILNISGGSTLTTNGPLNMGGTGSSVSLSGGSVMSCAGMTLGGETGDTNSLSIAGASSVLNTTGLIRVGHNLFGDGGACAMSITDGAVLNSTFVDPAAASLRFRFVSGAGGSLTMNNSTINATDEIEYSNPVTPMSMTNSTIHSPKLTLINASLSVSGVIDAEVSVLAAITNITATGPLTMGKLSSPNSLNGSGTINVGPHTVTMLDANFAFLGKFIVMAGGTLNAQNGFIVQPAGSVNGFGTINANISNGGQILPSGTGLTLLGSLDDDGVGISGSRLTFAAGSSYSGNGNLGCEVVTLPGSTITPAGQLLMGNSSSVNGVNIGGTLNIGPHIVELRDFNGAQVSGTVNIAGGTMFNPSRVRFEGGPLPQLNGTGTVVGDCFIDGFVSPGVTSGDQTGHLAFDTLTFGTFSMLLIDIEGDQPGTFDTIGTVDDLDLNGTTLSVNRLGNYFPPRGTRYRIATGALFGSEFSTVSAPGFHVEYVIGGVDLVFDKLCDSLDFNNDDSIFDPQDIDAFLSVFSEGPCIPEENTCNDIDFNNDGSVFDPIDIDAFLSMFSEGPCL